MRRRHYYYIEVYWGTRLHILLLYYIELYWGMRLLIRLPYGQSLVRTTGAPSKRKSSTPSGVRAIRVRRSLVNLVRVISFVRATWEPSTRSQAVLRAMRATRGRGIHVSQALMADGPYSLG